MKLSKNQRRIKRKFRIRKKVRGTPDRPRLVVFRSNRHIYAQLIDDTQARTLVACSTQHLEDFGSLNSETAKSVGAKLAEKAASQNISSVVFDRNGYYYHGQIKALADAARSGGLNF
ncbi:50S ribosomal protein L18 [Desulfonatronospira sp.]|uniref:50S ribosomal protein L18 n=1 Tax=Desulfonatronospira sp. TaxID=1962951 RepID=UPI0025C6BD28|nr:50S ribosomal protein L18 [Desulfonatronospira sp.]